MVSLSPDHFNIREWTAGIDDHCVDDLKMAVQENHKN